MTTIVWSDFKGILPRLDEHRLAGIGSTKAHNVNLDRGLLEPWPAAEVIGDYPGDNKSITCSPCLQAWEEEGVRVIPISPSVSPELRLFAVDHPDGPKVATEVDLCKKKLYPLGVPIPGTPGISAGAGCDCGTTPVTVRVSYVRNYPYSQESALSMPSNTVLAGQGGAVNVSASPPSGYSLRVYATLGPPVNAKGQASGESAVSGYFYVTNGRSFTFESVGEGELAPNDDWYPPPSDLRMLVGDDNGVLFGVSGKREVWASYPHQYHAFPSDMNVVLDDDIIGLHLFGGSSVVVMTTGHPYILAYNPKSTTVSVSKFRRPAPCLDDAAAAVGTGGIIYPSTNGLMLWDGKNMSSFSDMYWTIRQWRALVKGKKIRALIHQESYYFWIEGDDRGYRIPFGDTVFQIDKKKALLTTIDIDCFHPSSYCISDTDELYYFQDGDPGTMMQWDPDGNTDCSGCGFDVIMPVLAMPALDSPRSLWFEMLSISGPTQWQLLSHDCGDWEIIDEGTIKDCEPFNFRRLHRRNYNLALRIFGCGTVRRAAIGSSFRAIAEATKQNV